jgi:catechol 2,3-dioxygenase-like lactoylglutathione lyase family enzyme
MSLKQVLLLSRNLDKAVGLWTEGLGFTLVHQSETYAELKDERDARIAIREVDSEAFLSTGYSPILSIAMSEPLAPLATKLQESHNCSVDGQVVASEALETVMLRTADGHMVGLVRELTTVEEPGAVEELDERQQEIRRLLDSLKL